jgi:hypothetical protein
MLLMSVLMASCAPAGNETASPTAIITATAIPQPAPSPEPATPTPLPPAVTMSELGITDQKVIDVFKGIETTIRHESDGTLSVNAIGYQNETKIEGKYFIIPGAFSGNFDIKNDYRPATVDAYTFDSQGNKVNAKLIWDQEHSNWRVPFAVNKIPFMPEGDQKIVVESALLYFRDHPPFGEGAVASYIKNGGNSIFFEYLQIDGIGPAKTAILKSKGNDNKTLTKDQATMKFTDVGVYYYIDGVPYIVPIMVNLDPIDQKAPTADEFKVLLGASGREVKNMTEEERIVYIKKLDHLSGSFLYPVPYLYGDANFQKKFPLLAKLLQLPNNVIDPDNIISIHIGELGPKKQLEYLIAHLDTGGNIIYDNLAPIIQTMLFFFNFAGPGS